MLPETSTRVLEENRETKEKLSNISQTISEMAKSYNEAAVSEVKEDEIKKQEEKCLQTFIEELKNNLEGLEQNILYEDLYDSENIQKDIYMCLLENEIMTEKELLNILEKNNCYILNSDESKENINEDIRKAMKSINSAYRVSNLSFIWKKKLEENKKNVSKQLEGVSKVISDLANNISESEDSFLEEKEKIKILLEQKQIDIKDMQIYQEKTGRYKVKVYTGTCENEDGTNCYMKKIGQCIEKILRHQMILQNQECGLRQNKDSCMYSFISQDEFRLQVGIAKSTKKGSPISGDTSLQTKLEDGKVLLAISDGMGSGPEARKSSKIAIKMLERLLISGFEKENSIKLINSAIFSNTDEDMYATLDVEIFDLYAGNVEFIKNAACPTYIKRQGGVQMLKTESLPAGIINDIEISTYDKDLEDGDIFVICSDGVIDSNKEFLNKELWVKYLLEDIETEDVQKIADIIINEAIDYDYGQEKDDMTVVVAKVKKR